MPGLTQGARISNYVLESKRGSGGFGEVWRARHHIFGDIVAIKVAHDPRFVRGLQREGVAVRALKHPNIIRALDLDPYADPPYLVMEFIEGPSLQEAVEHYRGAFPIAAAVVVLRGVLQALTAAHASGIIHRDIKPANILLNCPMASLPLIAEQAVRVTDFGLGLATPDVTQSLLQSGSLQETESGRLVGTIAYMSPEQREGRDVDARSDLYSCAIVLFEMLTGERPQGADLPSVLRSETPSWLDRVYRQAYARYDRRFASAGEMLARLAPALGESSSSSMQTPGESRPCPDCRNEMKQADRFCIQCGRQASDAIPRCPNCRAFVQSTDRFCIFCGNDLRVLAL